MLITLLKSVTLCLVCLLQYGIVLLNLDKIYILKQFVSIDIRSTHELRHKSDSDENTNKVEASTITEVELVRDSNGFPII